MNGKTISPYSLFFIFFFSYIMREKSGYNWVKHLKSICFAMNSTPKRITGNYSPFEIFFNRPNAGSITRMIEKVSNSVAKGAKNMIKYRMKNSKCSVYDIDEEVFIRYPPTGSRVPKNVLFSKELW